MAASSIGRFSLNAGEVSRLALARVDLQKLRAACEIQSNFLPRVLGPCELRPGTRQLDRTRNDEAAKLLEFFFDEATTDLLVLTPNVMRVMSGGVFINRPAVTGQTINGDFATDLSGWADADEAGATSDWDPSSAMSLLGTGLNYARRDQPVVVNEPGVEHALRINVTHGVVLLQVGTAAGDTTYIEATLFAGWHSLAFIPTGDFWIRLLYTHPAHWTDDLIRTIAECPKVARYVDLPLQHIHENMLQRMRRETSRQHITNLVRKIRAEIPGIAIRTTFIVGFPGETEACFETLLEFIGESKFERLGVFTYSREYGTPAGSMAGQISNAVKRRSARPCCSR
jgi:hypothetical protein